MKASQDEDLDENYVAYVCLFFTRPTITIINGAARHVLFGVGAFHFVISLVPPSLLWIVQALGFGMH